MKICPKCKKEKEDNFFYKNTKICKKCKNESHNKWASENRKHLKQYRNKYYIQNNNVKIKRKERDDKNKEKIKEQKRQWYIKNKEKEKHRALKYYHDHSVERKNYKKQNRDKILKTSSKYNKLYRKRRIQNDPSYKLRNNISGIIREALKRQSSSKYGKSIFQYLPYTIVQLRKHLESLFEPGMTWNNYGKYCAKSWDDNNILTWKWNIDHIIPQADLLYSSMEDENFKKCWSLENLRPLWAKQNLIEGATRMRHKK